ncbi:TolC family protein [candidate division KSB1 bacterium]|nr:TolC family protein [candidate division KSB1 bacterium]
MRLKGKSTVLISTILLLLFGASFAQQELVLTLEKSVDLAITKNPQIKIAEKELAKAKTGIWEAYSIIMPLLNASANFQHSWEIQKNVMPNFLKPTLAPLFSAMSEFESIPGVGEMIGDIPDPDAIPDYLELSFGLENTFMYGVTLTQPLYLGGAAISGIKISHAAKRAAERNLESKRQNLIYQSVNAFYACLTTQKVVEVQQEALRQSEANLDIVTKKYNAGAASGFDQMRAQVEVANLKPVVISAQNAHEAAQTQLRMILGLDRNTNIILEGQLSYIEDEFGDQDLAEIQSQALRTRPEMQALSEQIYIAQKGVSIARSSFMPKLFFQTDYSYLAMKDNLHISQSDFNKGFSSAISLQIPLFTGFKNCKQYQKAKLDYRLMLDTEKQVSDGIQAEAEFAYNMFKEARQKYNAANQSVGLAEEALRLANMMYEEGANTQLDVLNSQLALTRARLNHVSSLYEYQMARYQLRKVTGTLKRIL